MTKKFHNESGEGVVELLHTTTQGLSSNEAEARLKKYGLNKLPEEKKLSTLALFVRQFQNPLIYILFVAMAISFVTGHLVDGWIIVVVIVLSSVVGFLQEYKTNTALTRLKNMIEHKAKVFRDGKEVILAQEMLVPGDIVSLTPGDSVPADARILTLQNFEVIEAMLTGESEPSSKVLDILPAETALADRENMVYMGTVVARGNAEAVVVSTGAQTELGAVATMLRDTKDEQTPVQKQLNRFGRMIAVILVVLNVIIFGIGVWSGKPLFEMFLTSVALVVAAIPEGLLTAMVIVLAVGMQRLATRKGLVRKMLAVETLGSVSVICTDKTGTLTRGEMRVDDIITEFPSQSENSLEENAEPVVKGGRTLDTFAVKIGLLNNNAVVEDKKKKIEEWTIYGNPTEKALLLEGYEAGLDRHELEVQEPRIAEIPFDSEYKYMATLHTDGKVRVVYAKGAPEKILQMCSRIRECGQEAVLTPEHRECVQAEYMRFSGTGLRVIGLAYKQGVHSDENGDFSHGNLGDLVFVGLVTLKDPLRVEARETLEQVHDAGIRSIIITGDHKLTAQAVASELGIEVTDEQIMEGAKLDACTDIELQELVTNITLFARVEPRHKIRIVTALQANGEVVAMTGDGVNDAPALKKADIGVAVGSGTDVTKEVADLVLLDNNFKTIVEAVRGGRIVFNNIRKVLLYLLGFSFSQMIVISGSVLAGMPLAILPAQILWINLIQDAAPAMALAFSKIDEGVMKEKPRKKKESLLANILKVRLGIYIVVMNSMLFGLFYYVWNTTQDIVHARTMVFASLAVTSVLYIYSVRGLNMSVLKLNPFSNTYVTLASVGGILMMLIAIYVPFFNTVLETSLLGVVDWAILISYGVIGVVVYEVCKLFTSTKNR